MLIAGWRDRVRASGYDRRYQSKRRGADALSQLIGEQTIAMKRSLNPRRTFNVKLGAFPVQHSEHVAAVRFGAET